jgi:hypothetical protein
VLRSPAPSIQAGRSGARHVGSCAQPQTTWGGDRWIAVPGIRCTSVDTGWVITVYEETVHEAIGTNELTLSAAW